jgi:hypothetical protein
MQPVQVNEIPGEVVPPEPYGIITSVVLLRTPAAAGMADPAIPKVSDSAIRVNVNSDKQDLVFLFVSG